MNISECDVGVGNPKRHSRCSKPSHAVVSTVSPFAHLSRRQQVSRSLAWAILCTCNSPPEQPHQRPAHDTAARIVAVLDLARVLHHLQQLASLQLDPALAVLAARIVLHSRGELLCREGFDRGCHWAERVVRKSEERGARKGEERETTAFFGSEMPCVPAAARRAVGLT